MDNLTPSSPEFAEYTLDLFRGRIRILGDMIESGEIREATLPLESLLREIEQMLGPVASPLTPVLRLQLTDAHKRLRRGQQPASTSLHGILEALNDTLLHW